MFYNVWAKVGVTLPRIAFCFHSLVCVSVSNYVYKFASLFDSIMSDISDSLRRLLVYKCYMFLDNFFHVLFHLLPYNLSKIFFFFSHPCILLFLLFLHETIETIETIIGCTLFGQLVNGILIGNERDVSVFHECSTSLCLLIFFSSNFTKSVIPTNWSRYCVSRVKVKGMATSDDSCR